MLVVARTVQTINSCYSSSEYSCRSWHVSQVYCVALPTAVCPAPKLFPGCKGPVPYRLVEKCHPPCQVMSGNEVPSLSRTVHRSTWTLGTRRDYLFIHIHLHLLLDHPWETQSKVFSES